MSKKLLIVVLIVVSLIAVVWILRHNYELSAEYNYITAKLDIKNGEAKIVNVGIAKPMDKDKEINKISSSYGFKNIYISADSAKNQLTGIKNYNKLIEAYLAMRNGTGWRQRYQKEVDALVTSH